MRRGAADIATRVAQLGAYAAAFLAPIVVAAAVTAAEKLAQALFAASRWAGPRWQFSFVVEIIQTKMKL